jgi:hypothetical protein
VKKILVLLALALVGHFVYRSLADSKQADEAAWNL